MTTNLNPTEEPERMEDYQNAFWQSQSEVTRLRAELEAKDNEHEEYKETIAHLYTERVLNKRALEHHQFVELGDIDDRYPPRETRWLLPYLAASGAVSILHAGPKIGKTNLVVSAMASAQQSVAFLGITAEPFKTLYLTDERIYTLQHRLNGSLIEKAGDAVTFLPHNLLEDDELDWGSICQKVVNQMNRNPFELLVLDCLGSWIGLNDFNDYAAAGRRLRELGRFHRHLEEKVAQRPVGILAVHHDRKGSGRHGEGSLGSQAITGMVDHIVQLVRDNHDDNISARILHFDSRLFGAESLERMDIEYRPEERDYITRERQKTGKDTYDAIIDFALEQDGDWTRDELTVHLEEVLEKVPNKGAVNKLLSSAVDARQDLMVTEKGAGKVTRYQIDPAKAATNAVVRRPE